MSVFMCTSLSWLTWSSCAIKHFEKWKRILFFFLIPHNVIIYWSICMCDTCKNISSSQAFRRCLQNLSMTRLKNFRNFGWNHISEDIDKNLKIHWTTSLLVSHCSRFYCTCHIKCLWTHICGITGESWWQVLLYMLYRGPQTWLSCYRWSILAGFTINAI